MESVGECQTFRDDGRVSFKVPYIVRIEHNMSAGLQKQEMVDPFVPLAVV